MGSNLTRSADRSIALATAKGTDIPNYQSTEVTLLERHHDSLFRTRFAPCVQRSGINPRYNCHGLTFASRRTWIPDSASIFTILREDEYDEIPIDGVLAGDIIVYYSENNDVEHSGIVVVPPILSDMKVAQVYSKWGKGSEMIHSAGQCPYDASRVRYYRVKS